MKIEPRAKLIWNTCPKHQMTWKEWLQLGYMAIVAVGVVVGLFWVFSGYPIIPVCLVLIAIKGIADEA